MADKKHLIYKEDLLDLFTVQAPSMSYNKMFMAVANAPTVEAVEVVRCKDCLSYQETIGKDSGKPCGYGSCYNPCAIITGIVYDEDFCSYGERKNDA